MVANNCIAVSQEKDEVRCSELVSSYLVNSVTLRSRIQVMPAMQQVCVLVWHFYPNILVFKMDINGYKNGYDKYGYS